jgi:hypothetical protein
LDFSFRNAFFLEKWNISSKRQHRWVSRCPEKRSTAVLPYWRGHSRSGLEDHMEEMPKSDTISQFFEDLFFSFKAIVSLLSFHSARGCIRYYCWNFQC